MKKLVLGTLLLSFSLVLCASNIESLELKANNGDARAAYQLAKIYEEQNDKEHSLQWYKKASSLLLEVQNKNSNLEESIATKALTANNTQQAYRSFYESYEDKETENSVRQMISQTFDISPYGTNYLLPVTYNAVDNADRKHQETKFQLSFKKSLVENFFGLNETFFAGYSQISWWQTSSESAPFRETNYQPELFMIMPHFIHDSALKSYKVGLLHESNGKENGKSRSWNRIYAKAYFQYGGLVLAPRIWYRIPESSTEDDNPNIDDYLGYGDLELMYPWKTNTFKLLVRNNFHFDSTNRGAVQLDWTFPLWEKNLFGYVQLYSGYSESLIDYDKRSDRIGIGFALSR